LILKQRIRKALYEVGKGGDPLASLFVNAVGGPLRIWLIYRGFSAVRGSGVSDIGTDRFEGGSYETKGTARLMWK